MASTRGSMDAIVRVSMNAEKSHAMRCAHPQLHRLVKWPQIVASLPMGVPTDFVTETTGWCGLSEQVTRGPNPPWLCTYQMGRFRPVTQLEISDRRFLQLV